MSKVRILNEDGVSFHTKIIDVESGKELEYIGLVELAFDAQSGPIHARLTQYCTPIDIIADAEIKRICSYCGTPLNRDGRPL